MLNYSSRAHVGVCESERGTFTTHMVDSDTDACRDCGFAPPPTVQWNHRDGPLMVRAGGTLKWLSWRERFMHWIGRWSLEDIARRPGGFSKLVYYPPHDTWLSLQAKDASGTGFGPASGMETRSGSIPKGRGPKGDSPAPQGDAHD